MRRIRWRAEETAKINLKWHITGKDSFTRMEKWGWTSYEASRHTGKAERIITDMEKNIWPILGNKNIKKGCPKCGCPKERIEYYNCGPIVYIRCPDCKYRMTEGVEAPIGELYETWNKQDPEEA